jgi:hypothetical protein
MFNLYSFEKSENQSKEKLNKPITVNILKDDKHKKRREELALKYRERMTDFITSLYHNNKFKVKDDLLQRIRESNNIVSVEFGLF